MSPTRHKRLTRLLPITLVAAGLAWAGVSNSADAAAPATPNCDRKTNNT